MLRARLLFPRRQLDPFRALVYRIGLAVGILLVVAVVTWLGRAGYRDADGGSLSVLDAVYYASVTVTTTGYGDITPSSPSARLVTSLVVTPARILFLVVLVGTTLELLTERFRQALAESRWRRKVNEHVVVVGYGTKGRGAIETLLASGTATAEQIVAIDSAASVADEARAAGFTVVHGDATRTPVLREARVEEARAVIVTCHRDDTATLVTLSVRELNPRASIAAAVRESENAHLLEQSGANNVIVSSEAAGRLLGLATDEPRAVSVLEDLLCAGRGLELCERPVAVEELGGPPRMLHGDLPIAIVRGGVRLAFDDADFLRTAAGDVVVCLRTER